MNNIIKIGAAVLVIGAVAAAAFMINKSADDFDETTENDTIFVFKKNTTLPCDITVFADDGKTADITPAMWEVTAPDGKSLYMLGSMHVLTKECYPLPDKIKTAFEGCDKFACEVNNTSGNPLSNTDAHSPKLPEGDTLKAHLSDEQYKLLSDYLSAHGRNVADFDSFAPWYVLSELEEPATSLQADGFTLDANIGLDRVLQISANIAGKEILELESPQSRADLFPSMSDGVAAAAIEQSCRTDEAAAKKKLSEQFAAWKTGDLDKIESISYSVEGVSDESVPLLEEYNKIFIIDRNRLMTDRIEEFLSGSDKVFVIAGAAHFTGSEGIPAMLEKDGYKVERVQ